VLHDHKRHPGDLWPNKIFIKYYLKSSRIITLSKYVSSKIKNVQVIETKLGRNLAPKIKEMELPQEFLFVGGRFKKYKNLSEVLKMIEYRQDLRFVFLGSGKYKKFNFPANVTRIDRWLLDEELEYVISKSIGVIAVYSEASQSGIIEQAVYWGRPILSSNKGGLSEQYEIGVEGIVINNLDMMSISNGVDKLLALTPKLTKKVLKTQNISYAIMNSKEFSDS